MATGGKWEDYKPPSWYFLMVAAKEIGCTPWDLEKQPVYWRDRALIKKEAEGEAKDMIERRNRQLEASRRNFGNQ